MKLALIFPGQGSQAVGMGRDLYQRSAAARAFFDHADAVLDMPLSRLCFEGPAEELMQTENAQPALLTTSSALLAAICERAGLAWTPDTLAPHPLPLQPGAVAGHSLGEYSALVAASALDFPTALRLVRRRGELMAQTSEGMMAAIIGLEQAALAAICAEASASGTVVIANQNSPGQLVISGSNAAVQHAMQLAREQGAKRALPLKVSAGFHSPLMAEAARGLAPAVAAASVHAPRIAVIANVTAAVLTEPEAIRQELVEQITAAVRWIDTVELLVQSGVETCVEIGPGAVLSGLVKRIAPGLRSITIASADDVAGLELAA